MQLHAGRDREVAQMKDGKTNDGCKKEKAGEQLRRQPSVLATTPPACYGKRQDDICLLWKACTYLVTEQSHATVLQPVYAVDNTIAYEEAEEFSATVIHHLPYATSSIQGRKVVPTALAYRSVNRCGRTSLLNPCGNAGFSHPTIRNFFSIRQKLNCTNDENRTDECH